ncbi:MAG: ThuA domain-containing protein [Thermoguttaceae bacterium]
MMHYSYSPNWIAAFLLCVAPLAGAAEEPSSETPSLSLAVQRRDESGRAVRQPRRFDPRHCAVVVIDTWDNHWCKTENARVSAMVPRMNRTLEAARKLGMQIVFAPSDVVGFYEEYPQRKAMLAIRKHPEPPTVALDLPEPPGPTDHCECGPGEPCPKSIAWKRQHPGISIAARDLITQPNDGRELLNLCQERGISTLFYVGAASNICVLHRACGVFNMRRHGLDAVVVRDLVRALTANGIGPDGRRDPDFTPAKGTALIERYIERSICPTVESKQLLTAAGMENPVADKRPRIVFVISEPEYHTAETLQVFAKERLDKAFRTTFVLGDPLKYELPGVEAVDEADLVFLSMRRQALSAVQMDHLERYLRSGKPIAAIRTSSHAFQAKDCPPGHVVWNHFDREVLGCNYSNYNAKSRATGYDVWLADGALAHPIIGGKEVTLHSASALYHVLPLDPATTMLLLGQWSKTEPAEPVAWTNSYEGARVFYTSLGCRDDFKIAAFNRFLVQAIRWTLGK